MINSWKLVRRSIRLLLAERSSSMAAAISYFALFSVAPAILVLLSVAGILLNRAEVLGFINIELGRLVGPEAAQYISRLVAVFNARGSTLGAVVGLVITYVGASAVLHQMQMGLNRLWINPLPQGSRVFRFVKYRVNALLWLLAVAGLLFVSILYSTWMHVLLLSVQSPSAKEIISSTNALAIFLLIWLLVFLVYKILPSIKMANKPVVIGSLIVTLLFFVGNLLFGLYIGRIKVFSLYGAAGALVSILLWTYYMSQIFLFGAALIKQINDLPKNSSSPKPPTRTLK